MPFSNRYANKAALLSAFLFPGSGHWFLQLYVRAAIFIGLSIFALGLFLGQVFELSQMIADQILKGTIAYDFGVLFQEIRQSVTAIYMSDNMRMARYLLLGVWVISTIDAYREGRRRQTPSN